MNLMSSIAETILRRKKPAIFVIVLYPQISETGHIPIHVKIRTESYDLISMLFLCNCNKKFERGSNNFFEPFLYSDL
jgi:hypothetical protein